MFIEEVEIKNYRGFKHLKNVKLSKLTVLIGENDSGKSNFLNALALPLASSSIDFNQKRLNVSDINRDSIINFYQSVINNETEDIQLEKIPKVFVTLQFKVNPKEYYELEIVSKWCDENENGEPCYKIRYEFKPKDDLDFLSAVESLLIGIDDIKDVKWFTLAIELYEYQVVSVHNEKQISFNELKHVVVKTIGAERDDFSDSNSMKSNNILTKLLIDTLDDKEKKLINSAYTAFFSSIEETKTFDKVLKKDDGFENIKNYIEELECIPNLPNLKSILSNITLGYGEDFLYQKGLGERNLVYLFLLFTYYKKPSLEKFNVCCIEEPEAHLSVNNLRLGIDYIRKSVEKSSDLFQTILTTHNPNIINKLQIDNVVAISADNAVSLSTSTEELQNYLRKRPNFDILKLLFTNNVLLVEGPSEEMLINTVLFLNKDKLSNIEVISIGQKGFKTFLDIWLNLNSYNPIKKIGIVRDFDDQINAKNEHDVYDEKFKNITVRTTENYTLEDDLVSTGNNCSVLSKLFKIKNDPKTVSEYMKSGKTEGILKLCDAIARDKKPIIIELPNHIKEVIQALS